METAPRRIAPLLLVLALASLACQDRHAPAPSTQPNVLLISLDTLRRDHVGFFEPTSHATPNLDAFAAESLAFDQAFTHHPWTLTAHATLLSGLLPAVHGLLADRAFREEVELMPEVFADAGYATIGLVSNCGWLAPKYGFGQGFGSYRVVEGDAGPKIDALFAQLDSLAGQPFFAFTHLFDAHSDFERLPYDSAAGIQARYTDWYTGDFDGTLAEHPDWGHSSALLKRMNREGATLDGDERRLLVDLYDAGVETMDVQLGRLFAGLEARGLLATTIVMIVADHGEEFYEHGRALHEGQYDELIRIPMLLHTPGGRPGRTDELVGLVDVAPTLLELTGLAQPADMQGRSLAALARNEQLEESRDFVLLDNSMFFGRRSRDEAAIFGPDGFGLFDLASDPIQTHNLVTDPAHAARAQELAAWLQAQRAAMAPLIERLAALPGSAPQTQAEQAALGKLGYSD